MISEHSKVFILQSLFHINLANRAVGVAAYDDSLLGSIDGTPVEVEGSQNARCFGHCFVNSCRVIEMNTLTVCFKKRVVDVFAAIDLAKQFAPTLVTEGGSVMEAKEVQPLKQ